MIKYLVKPLVFIRSYLLDIVVSLYPYSHNKDISDTKEIQFLYDLAENIQKLKKEGNTYPLQAFKTFNGDVPTVQGNLDIPIILSRSKYIKKGKSSLCSGVSIVPCRKLEGVFDLQGKQVFEANNGTLFVYIHVIGTPLSAVLGVTDPEEISTAPYDYGVFVSPTLIEIKDTSISEQFQLSAINLVKQISNLTFTQELSLVNRITELQEIAYRQGSYKPTKELGARG